MKKLLFPFSLAIAVAWYSPGQATAQVQFTRHNIDKNLSGAYWVYATDMDGDRDLDLVTASYRGLHWWSNSQGKFSKRFIGSFTGAWGAYAADVDRDGDVDVMGASSGLDEFGYWRRKGSGFSKVSLGAALGPESIHAGDFDGDGDLDIVGAAWSDGQILWWRHEGNGRFSRRVVASLRSAHSVFAADLDRDGDTDVVACGAGDTKWFRNDGKGNFNSRRISRKGGLSVFAADLDGDGDMDVLRPQRDGDLVLFKNSGGNFSRQVIEADFGASWSVAAGDIDGDGDLEVAAAGFNANAIKVWFNDGGGRFDKGQVVDDVSEPRSVFIADLDRDGDGDIVSAIRGDRDLVWYEVRGKGSTPKWITVSKPNGGERLVGGAQATIEWRTAGAIDQVRIEYSLNDGEEWTTIESRHANEGVYSWQVPAGATEHGLIRVSDADQNGISDMSDDVFEIVASSSEEIVIASFSPQSGGPGTVVTIRGRNFNGVSKVTFNGASASTFSVASEEEILATVPQGVSTGPIGLTSSNGSIFSTDSFTVEIPGETVTLTFTPRHDTWVRSNRPDANNGSEQILRVRQTRSVDREAFLKFEVQGLSGPVQRAVVRLYVTDESSQGGAIFPVSNHFKNTTNPWTENELTWRNAPESLGGLLSSIDQVDIGEVAEFDVTDVVNGNGSYSFAVKSTSSDIVIYSSKEGAVAPVLVVTTVGAVASGPRIHSIQPTWGVAGQEVTITGSQFEGASSVLFNGEPASDFSVTSETQIIAFVPNSATTGPIILKNSEGAATSRESFEVVMSPVIDSFTPTSGPPGTEVTISGKNFSHLSNVSFNELPATFATVSSTVVRALVPQGDAAGSIQMTNAAGAGSSVREFLVTNPPQNLTLHPTDDSFVRSNRPSANYGDSQELRVRLSSAKHQSYLKFLVLGVGAVTRATLRLHVDDGGPDGGSVFLVSNNYAGTETAWSEAGLTWENAPKISGSPIDAIGSVSANQVVEFDVTSAITGDGTYSFAIANSSSDAVRYSPKESGFSPELLLERKADTPTPTIASFSPTAGEVGTEVTVLGNNFDSNLQLFFDTVSADTIFVDSRSRVRATVPAEATTSQIEIVTDEGFTVSEDPFVVIKSPEIISFHPASGPVGSTLTITGVNFTGTTEVAFRGIGATDYSIENAQLIHAVVPDEAQTGQISVRNAAGVSHSSDEFAVTIPRGPLTFQATDDSFVRSNRPNRNYVTEPKLRVRKTSSAEYYAYLKFDVTGVSEPVERAMLKLRVTDAGPDGGTVYLSSNHYQGTNEPWTEAGLIWNNRPESVGPPIAVVGETEFQETVEIDVSDAIESNGIVSFVLKSGARGTVKYSSKEGVQGPELVVENSGRSSRARSASGQLTSLNSSHLGTLSQPTQLRLEPNYPNPFNLGTNIEYSLPTDGTVRLLIYNIRGRLVKTLVNGPERAGSKRIQWQGRNDRGREVASGFYFVRLLFGERQIIKKMSLQK